MLLAVRSRGKQHRREKKTHSSHFSGVPKTKKKKKNGEGMRVLLEECNFKRARGGFGPPNDDSLKNSAPSKKRGAMYFTQWDQKEKKRRERKDEKEGGRVRRPEIWGTFFNVDTGEGSGPT